MTDPGSADDGSVRGEAARADRAFVRRVAARLAGSEGVRPFLDLATALPTADTTHQVAQRVAPRSPTCALLRSAPEGATR